MKTTQPKLTPELRGRKRKPPFSLSKRAGKFRTLRRYGPDNRIRWTWVSGRAVKFRGFERFRFFIYRGTCWYAVERSTGFGINCGFDVTIEEAAKAAHETLLVDGVKKLRLAIKKAKASKNNTNER